MEIIKQLKADLKALGISQGDTVMLHSSFKSLGGGISASAFFKCFLEVLGENGTLILPAFSYDTVNYENLLFDKHNTPSCVGFLPEFFRTQVSGVKRSIHATHSCCVIGKNADLLIKDHEKDLTPVGENSPITKLPDLNGKILFLGAHPDHNTAFHGIEEKGNAPYIFDLNKRIEYILKDGEKEIKQSALRHDFHKADVDYEQKYSRVLDILDESDYSKGKVLKADCYLLSAKAVWEKGVAKIKQDPYFFVNKIYK